MPKLKTHSSAKKRFKLTGTGKVKRKHAFKSHILTKKETKRKRNLTHIALVDKTDMYRVNQGAFAEGAAALGALAGEQVAAAGTAAEDLAGACDLEPFGDGFFGLNAFGTTHNLNWFSKKRAHCRQWAWAVQGVISTSCMRVRAIGWQAHRTGGALRRR